VKPPGGGHEEGRDRFKPSFLHSKENQPGMDGDFRGCGLWIILWHHLGLLARPQRGSRGRAARVSGRAEPLNMRACFPAPPFPKPGQKARSEAKSCFYPRKSPSMPGKSFLPFEDDVD